MRRYWASSRAAFTALPIMAQSFTGCSAHTSGDDAMPKKMISFSFAVIAGACSALTTSVCRLRANESPSVKKWEMTMDPT